MAVKPWCVGSVLCWVYIIARGWGAWNSSVTWRRTRTDSWACLNKEIGSLRQNLATRIHDYIVWQIWKLYRLHTRVQLWRGGNSPTPSSLRLRFSWVGHILTSLLLQTCYPSHMALQPHHEGSSTRTLRIPKDQQQGRNGGQAYSQNFFDIPPP